MENKDAVLLVGPSGRKFRCNTALLRYQAVIIEKVMDGEELSADERAELSGVWEMIHAITDEEVK